MSIGRNKVTPIARAVAVQYANGHSEYRPAGSDSRVRFQPLRGFYLEVGKDGEIDEALAAAKVEQIEIRHQRDSGTEIVRHWHLGPELKLYPVTAGPVAPTAAASVARAYDTAEAGIGLRWGQGQGERSKLAIRCYLDVLVRQGCYKLVQLVTRSRMTDELLKALADHVRVCEILDNIVNREMHPAIVACHEIALTLGTGDDADWGKGAASTVTPLMSLHPQADDEITREYLRPIWRSDELHAAAYREWEGVKRWAHDYRAGNEHSAGNGNH